MMVWKNQPRYNKHVWAFIHFCRRQGDEIDIVYKNNDLMDVYVYKGGKDHGIEGG